MPENSQPAAIHCPVCRQSLPADTRFCISCGWKDDGDAYSRRFTTEKKWQDRINWIWLWSSYLSGRWWRR